MSEETNQKNEATEQENNEQEQNSYPLPSNATLEHSAKLSICKDKPIMLDYWTASCDKTVLIGVRENQEKLLVKSEDEYTSPIETIFGSGAEYIIVTENSIYLVQSSIDTKIIL